MSIFALVLFIGALNCPVTKLVNNSEQKWNDVDNQNYKIAKKVCAIRKGGRSPCLKTFIKKKERVYYAICGKPS